MKKHPLREYCEKVEKELRQWTGWKAQFVRGQQRVARPSGDGKGGE